ncbi:MAG: macrolide ABC transporter ATP-binding protein [Bdellovibrio sp. ArHS]|uniref:MacB family efflux pump subunit n=1 Tax=Bdellovibrio sp. ArHS TaxID=1569284 RepID=UPI00058333EE|nr:MacB family efflux pump subunit [Bdellovibrio sp. ArHS]KHD87944.1 MAG: macrolide ABC transporter ATP-binding protein [Bdellovibrio sp. ArHS]
MIEIKDIRKSYKMGSETVHVLNGIDLKIERGDFVAIMGPSGSGKSTLMHILGLLDAPTSGTYQLQGREVSSLTEDELALVRREEVGFIFQQFNLLPRIEAWQNVSLPLIYSENGYNFEKAKKLIEQVGLTDRIHHKSNELSGGQQQRIAIARSLVNNPDIVFADEPTGNLDSKSEKEIMKILKDLNEQGITVIIVTHEEEIGQQTKRLIRLRDGVLQSDERLKPLGAVASIGKSFNPKTKKFPLQEMIEHLHQGFRTLAANKVRSGLSMLGILIGVAAVVGMLALGKGAQKDIEKQLSSLGSNLLVLRAGNVRVGGVMQESGARIRITLEDVTAIRSEVDGVKEVSPTSSGRGQVTFLNKNWNTQVQGVSPSYAAIRTSEPTFGRFFSNEEVQRRALVAVVGVTVARELFGEKSPIGEMIKINRINFQVIGVLPEKGAAGPQDQDDKILVPINTAMYRLFGKNYVDSVDIEVTRAEDIPSVQDDVMTLMNKRHRVAKSAQEDAFNIFNMADIQQALNATGKTMSMLLASIAAISLVVGGIGIMNIMLVSVTERTKEIGLRKAIGARRRDILLQFLAESIVVSVCGGVLGIILGLGFSVIISTLLGWSTVVSVTSVLMSFSFSALIGIIFGSYPASKASKLHPIEALRYE